MTFLTIEKSPWGWTAYLTGTKRAVAHSHSRALLESYVKEYGQ